MPRAECDGGPDELGQMSGGHVCSRPGAAWAEAGGWALCQPLSGAEESPCDDSGSLQSPRGTWSCGETGVLGPVTHSGVAERALPWESECWCHRYLRSHLFPVCKTVPSEGGVLYLPASSPKSSALWSRSSFHLQTEGRVISSHIQWERRRGPQSS